MRSPLSVRCLLAGSIVLGVLASASAGEVTIAGSSTVKPIIDKATKEFAGSHPDTKFVVGGGGSGHGVKAAAGGDVAIGMASRAMKDSERSSYPNVKPVKIAVDGIGIIVHKKNGVGDLSTDQVRDIFSGRITNWKDVGGDDAPIVLISANSHHGTFDVFAKHFGFDAIEDAGMITFAEGGSSAKAKAVDGNMKSLAGVMTKPNAISYASLGAALTLAGKGAPVKILDLDGVSADLNNVVDGQYKLQRALFLLTDGEPSGEVGEFLEFMVDGPGQQLIESEGYIPVN